MARPHDLVAGNCYFTLFYYDNDLLIPWIQTLIYRRVDAYDDGRRVWLFEEPSSTDTAGPVIPVGFPDEHLDQVLDLNELLSQLGGISDFHPIQSPSESPSEVGIKDDVRRELREQILAFGSDQNCSSVTVTILFTDDALSLGRRKGGGFEMGFYAHPKVGNADKGIVEHFKTRGVDPHVDYLANNGMTRVLAFSIPDDMHELEHLCACIFVEIYRIRQDDTLKFYQHRSQDMVRIS